MNYTKWILISLSIFFGLLVSSSAFAQSLTIGSGDARRNVIDIPISFEAGTEPVVGFQMDVVYDPRLFGEPICLGGELFFGACNALPALGEVRVIALHPSLMPLVSGTYFTIRFPVLPRPGRGSVTLLGARNTLFVNADSEEVVHTIYTGQIRIR